MQGIFQMSELALAFFLACSQRRKLLFCKVQARAVLCGITYVDRVMPEREILFLCMSYSLLLALSGITQSWTRLFSNLVCLAWALS